MSQTTAQRSETESGKHSTVTVLVNTKPVTLPSHKVTGMEVKLAAIAQGVQIKADFHLVLEASEGHRAREIADDRTVSVTKRSEFTANDGDDDS